MREIKFRAWSKVNKVMYYDSGYKCDHDLFYVMQYTGINDKNGNEVYENDIIEIGNKILEVIFDNGCFYSPFTLPNGNISKYRLGGWDKEELLVIGNIHTTPELINY